MDDSGTSRHNVAQMGYEVSQQLRYNGDANYTCAKATNIQTIVIAAQTLVMVLQVIVLLVIVFVLGGN